MREDFMDGPDETSRSIDLSNTIFLVKGSLAMKFLLIFLMFFLFLFLRVLMIAHNNILNLVKLR